MSEEVGLPDTQITPGNVLKSLTWEKECLNTMAGLYTSYIFVNPFSIIKGNKVFKRKHRGSSLNYPCSPKNTLKA